MARNRDIELTLYAPTRCGRVYLLASSTLHCAVTAANNIFTFATTRGTLLYLYTTHKKYYQRSASGVCCRKHKMWSRRRFVLHAKRSSEAHECSKEDSYIQTPWTLVGRAVGG